MARTQIPEVVVTVWSETRVPPGAAEPDSAVVRDAVARHAAALVDELRERLGDTVHADLRPEAEAWAAHDVLQDAECAERERQGYPQPPFAVVRCCIPTAD